MQRLRLYDVRVSRLPSVIGSCVADTSTLARYVNSAQQRLIYCKEAGEESWYGTWAEVLFYVSRDNPYLTLPREIARLEVAVLCDETLPIYNQFYEYLQFGNGRLPKQFRRSNPTCLPQVLSRDNVPTMVDLPGTSYLRIYMANAADTSGRVFINGLDQNGKQVYSQDGADRVQGEFLAFESPFNTTDSLWSRISGIQKDQTLGIVELWAVNADTGDETLLSILQPGETSTSYRRYYFSNLPMTCCPPSLPAGTVEPLQVRAICKIEPATVYTDTDYLVIQNLEAIIEECQAVRYSEMDSTTAKAMEQNRHQAAVNLLNGELTHYYGRNNPSVTVLPYGSADLRQQCIGTMI